MNNMTDMALVAFFEHISQALRAPEKYPLESREKLASSLDIIIGEGKKTILTNLMNEAVTDKPEREDR